MVCFRYIIVNTVHRGDDDDDDDDNNNNNNLHSLQYTLLQTCLLAPSSLQHYPHIQPPSIYVGAALRENWHMSNFI
jgi:hypothetical protein